MSATPTSLIVASTVTGFISFAFTFLTLLRVTWNSLRTLGEAPSEIRYTFANLKSSLHEERELLRRTAKYRYRRRSHSGKRNRSRSGRHKADGLAESAMLFQDPSEGVAQWRVMNDTVKRLCRQFHEIEKPFLNDAAVKKAGTEDEDEEKGRRWRDDDREYVIGGYINDYSDMTVNHRILWLWKKSQVVEIRDSLTRLQVRRTAQEMTASWL